MTSLGLVVEGYRIRRKYDGSPLTKHVEMTRRELSRSRDSGSDEISVKV